MPARGQPEGTGQVSEGSLQTWERACPRRTLQGILSPAAPLPDSFLVPSWDIPQPGPSSHEEAEEVVKVQMVPPLCQRG